jgi:hypothetical protein
VAQWLGPGAVARTCCVPHDDASRGSLEQRRSSRGRRDAEGGSGRQNAMRWGRGQWPRVRRRWMAVCLCSSVSRKKSGCRRRVDGGPRPDCVVPHDDQHPIAMGSEPTKPRRRWAGVSTTTEALSRHVQSRRRSAGSISQRRSQDSGPITILPRFGPRMGIRTMKAGPDRPSYHHIPGLRPPAERRASETRDVGASVECPCHHVFENLRRRWRRPRPHCREGAASGPAC